MRIGNYFKYFLGIFILFVTGLMGGNIIWTSIEIGLMYTLLDYFDGRNTPRGT